MLMGAIILALFLLSISLIIIEIKKSIENMNPRYYYGLAGLIGLVLVIVLIVQDNRFVPDEKNYSLEKTLELVVLQDNVGFQQGRFYLGSGFIGHRLSYVFYYKEGGGFRLDKIFAENTTVYEQERNDGLIKIYKFKKAGLIQDSWFTRYEIFIPKGSILQQFQLDAK